MRAATSCNTHDSRLKKYAALPNTVIAASIHTEEIPPKTYRTRQNKDTVTSFHTLTFLTTDSTGLLCNLSTLVALTQTYSPPTFCLPRTNVEQRFWNCRHFWQNPVDHMTYCANHMTFKYDVMQNNV